MDKETGNYCLLISIILRISKKMNSKEEQTNSEVTNLENENFIEQQKDQNDINKL